MIGRDERMQRVAIPHGVGAQRRWAAEVLGLVRGRPWEWNPDEGVGPGELRVRMLADEGDASNLPKVFGQKGRVHRFALRKDNALDHGFSEGCAGCQAILRGTLRLKPVVHE